MHGFTFYSCLKTKENCIIQESDPLSFSRVLNIVESLTSIVTKSKLLTLLYIIISIYRFDPFRALVRDLWQYSLHDTLYYQAILTGAMSCYCWIICLILSCLSIDATSLFCVIFMHFIH